MKKARGSFTILISGLLFLAALFVYANFIKPTYSDIKALQAEEQEKQSQKDQYQSISDHTQSLISTYQNYADLQKNIALSFPTDPSTPSILNQINGIAVQSGITVKSINGRELAINPSDSSFIGGKGTVRMNLTVSGSYEGFRAFLDKLESNVRIFDVNSISLDKSGNNSDNFDFNLEVDAYYQTATTLSTDKTQ